MAKRAISKLTKTLNYPLKNVSPRQRNEVRQEIADIIIDGIQEKLRKGQSPVRGEEFKRLSKQYAKKFKNGDRTPNLELTGEMLDHLEARVKGTKIEIGYFKDASTDAINKADGHNKFSGKTNDTPKRRFIPKKSQAFDSDIMTEVSKKVRQARIESPVQTRSRRPVETEQPVEAGIDLDNLFGEDEILALIEQALRGQDG